jgi:hypothetical protein
MQEKKLMEYRNQRGQFVKGHGATKPKGSFQKLSAEVRNFMSNFLMERSHELPGIWKRLSDKDKARLFVEMAAFVVPKQKDIAITSLTEPTAEAVAKIFDFTDEGETVLFIEETKRKVFPKTAG